MDINENEKKSSFTSYKSKNNLIYLKRAFSFSSLLLYLCIGIIITFGFWYYKNQESLSKNQNIYIISFLEDIKETYPISLLFSYFLPIDELIPDNPKVTNFSTSSLTSNSQNGILDGTIESHIRRFISSGNEQNDSSINNNLSSNSYQKNPSPINNSNLNSQRIPISENDKNRVINKLINITSGKDKDFKAEDLNYIKTILNSSNLSPEEKTKVNSITSGYEKQANEEINNFMDSIRDLK